MAVNDDFMNQFHEMTLALAKIDLSKTPNIQVMKMLREQLVAGGINWEAANKVVVRMKIEVTQDAFDHKLFKSCLHNYGTGVLKLYVGLTDIGFNVDDFVEVASRLVFEAKI